MDVKSDKSSFGQWMTDHKDAVAAASGALCLLLYCVDMGTDFRLALQYWTNGHPVWFALTLGFVLVPSFITNVFLAITGLPRLGWTTKALLVLSHTGPIVIFLQPILKVWGCLSESLIDQGNSNNAHVVNIMGLLEAFLEAAPQLMLQVYIQLRELSAGQGEKLFSSRDGLVWLASCLSSALTLAWTVTQFYRSEHKLGEKQLKLSISGTLMMMASHLLTINCKIVSMALLATVEPYAFWFLISAHFVLYFLLVDNVIPHALAGWGSTIITALLSMFELVIFKPGKQFTRGQYLMYYSVVYAEIVAAVAAWYLLTPWQCSGCAVGVVVTVLVGYPLGVTIQVLYYICLHRSDKGIPNRWLFTINTRG